MQSSSFALADDPCPSGLNVRKKSPIHLLEAMHELPQFPVRRIISEVFERAWKLLSTLA